MNKRQQQCATCRHWGDYSKDDAPYRQCTQQAHNNAVVYKLPSDKCEHWQSNRVKK